MDGSFFSFILTASAMILVIEGLLYALFPDFMRKVIATALSLPTNELRKASFISAALGLLLIWALGGIR